MALILEIALGITLGHFLIQWIYQWQQRRNYRRGMELLYPQPPKLPSTHQQDWQRYAARH